MPSNTTTASIPFTAEVYYGPSGWAWGLDAMGSVDGGECRGPSHGVEMVIRVLRDAGLVPTFAQGVAQDFVAIEATDDGRYVMTPL